jgi:hypothetical protein
LTQNAFLRGNLYYNPIVAHDGYARVEEMWEFCDDWKLFASITKHPIHIRAQFPLKMFCAHEVKELFLFPNELTQGCLVVSFYCLF